MAAFSIEHHDLPEGLFAAVQAEAVQVDSVGHHFAAAAAAIPGFGVALAASTGFVFTTSTCPRERMKSPTAVEPSRTITSPLR